MNLFFLRRPNKQAKQVKDILRITQKVINYRKDVLSSEVLKELADASLQVSESLSNNPASSVQEDYDRLEKLLRKHGGKIYPQSSWAEHVETIVVGVILIVSIRAFFIQNFKIPTNSMYPSFGGMVPEVFSEENPAPNPLMKVVRKVLFFASNYKIEAENSGDLYLVLREDLRLHVDQINTKKFFLFPSVSHVYEVAVDNKNYQITLPADFDYSWVLSERLGIKPIEFRSYIQNLLKSRQRVETVSDHRGTYNKIYINTGIKVDKGDDILNFDIITGDMLFVDRFTYHFRSPKVGEAIVFPTKNVESIKGEEKYYIKRMVGDGGDQLEIKEPVLYRNGAPIEGSDAFHSNAEQVPPFDGYIASGLLSSGQNFELPQETIFAMGDNSDNSEDSRFFGPVPRKEVIGKAVFIYYPFTKRWGLTD